MGNNSVSRTLGPKGKVVHSLAIRKGVYNKDLTGAVVAKHLQQACSCCKDMAGQAGYSPEEIQNIFGRQATIAMAQKLSQTATISTNALRKLRTLVKRPY